jgi:hypothetical protein
VLEEFLAEDVVVGWLAGEPVPILGEDHVDATGRDGVTQGIEPESIQRSPGCAILELSYDLILILLAILSQDLKLLTEGVPLIPLLLCAHTSV